MNAPKTITFSDRRGFQATLTLLRCNRRVATYLVSTPEQHDAPYEKSYTSRGLATLLRQLND